METALHLAAKNGQAEIVNFLAKRGCDINAKKKAVEKPHYIWQHRKITLT